MRLGAAQSSRLWRWLERPAVLTGHLLFCLPLGHVRVASAKKKPTNCVFKESRGVSLTVTGIPHVGAWFLASLSA